MAIELISNITPKNNGTFPLVASKDISVDEGQRLSSVLPFDVNNSTFSIVPAILLTQEQYDTLIEEGQVNIPQGLIVYSASTIYCIYESDGGAVT